jgi:hypothetical protein
LSHYFDRVSRKFRKFIKEKYTVMRETNFAWLYELAASNERYL